MFIVLVPLSVKPEQLDAFTTATLDVACVSSLEEKGCRGIHVIRQESEPTHFLLYEMFDSRPEALKHLEAEHFKRWKALTDPMLAEPSHATTYLQVS